MLHPASFSNNNEMHAQTSIKIE